MTPRCINAAKNNSKKIPKKEPKKTAGNSPVFLSNSGICVIKTVASPIKKIKTNKSGKKVRIPSQILVDFFIFS
jgi:hypothetical protein